MENMSEKLVDHVRVALRKALSGRHARRMPLDMLIRRVQSIFHKLLRDENLDAETYRTWKMMYNKRKRGCATQTQVLEDLFATLMRERERKEVRKKSKPETAKPEKTKAKKTKIKVPEAEFEKIFSISKLIDPEYAREMKTFYEENGVLCIDLEGKIDRRQAVREFVTKLFREMPYRDEFMLNFQLANGKEVHINNDEDIEDIVDVLLERRISSVNLARLKKCLPPHATFGAPCTPPSFHLDVENEIRQDPQLYWAVAFLLNNEWINCDFNRGIFRVPTVTEGEDFLHYDLDPRQVREDVDAHLQGKVCITECRFICVPGSNTREFLERFVEVYGPLYPGRKLGQAKYSLHPDKDPWDLFGKQRAYIVPAGHAVFWSPKILHGHPSFDRDTPLSMGFFLGFHPEVSAAERAIRRELFHTGGVPREWPSGDRVWFFPQKFLNFPKVLQSTVIDKLSPDAHAALVTTRTTKAGKEVPDMKPWGWKRTFERFPFTPLGECITGQRKWGE
jgi:hypothetical protein